MNNSVALDARGIVLKSFHVGHCLGGGRGLAALAAAPEARVKNES